MITRRQIFEQFTKTDLVAIASHFDLKGLGALNKGDIVTKLTRKRSIDIESVLNLLYRSYLKSLCMELDFLNRFQKMIDEYNSGAKNIEELFEELIKFAQNLKEEEQRAMREKLSEEELAIFDILTKPEPKLTKKEEAEIKRIVRALLDKLKQEKLVLDWFKQQRTKAEVKFFIENFYDKRLPKKYDKTIFQTKCDLTYTHIYDVYGRGYQKTGMYA